MYDVLTEKTLTLSILESDIINHQILLISHKKTVHTA